MDRVVLWLGGTPHTGRLVRPVVDAAAAVGRDVISVARPGYGGARRLRGRSVADGARVAVRVLDRLDLEDVIVVGYSGGGPHAIATAAGCPDRVRRVVAFGCIAPFAGTEEWFAGMADDSALRAATLGLDARAMLTNAFDPSSFIDADYEALDGEWGELGDDAAAADHMDWPGAIDDDVAFMQPWAFPMDDCTAPVLLAHGSHDRVIPSHHAHALAQSLPNATALVHDGDGHVSVLTTLAAHLQRSGVG